MDEVVLSGSFFLCSRVYSGFIISPNNKQDSRDEDVGAHHPREDFALPLRVAVDGVGPKDDATEDGEETRHHLDVDAGVVDLGEGTQQHDHSSEEGQLCLVRYIIDDRHDTRHLSL